MVCSGGLTWVLHQDGEVTWMEWVSSWELRAEGVPDDLVLKGLQEV